MTQREGSQDRNGGHYIASVFGSQDRMSWTPESGIGFAPAGTWLHRSIPIGDFGGPVDEMWALTLQHRPAFDHDELAQRRAHRALRRRHQLTAFRSSN